MGIIYQSWPLAHKDSQWESRGKILDNNKIIITLNNYKSE